MSPRFNYLLVYTCMLQSACVYVTPYRRDVQLPMYPLIIGKSTLDVGGNMNLQNTCIMSVKVVLIYYY